MTTLEFDPLASIRILFWRALASGTEWAVEHRAGVYQALTVAPFVTAALMAFMLGRIVGALLGLVSF
jgi:hypothetical protein